MAIVIADRVKETTTTAGTGAVTLLGASTGFQSFAAVGNANTTYYTIAAQIGNEWEVGIGTYTSSGTTLARTTVLANSLGTQPSALSFSAGTKDVFVTYPAGRAIYGNTTGSIVPLDNAITRFDTTAGNIIQTSLVTIADDGAITAPQVGSMIPFYYANQAAFPSASTSHGALAHSHADGAMFFAHGGAWIRIIDNGGPLGTPSSGTATNITGLPISTGVSGLGTGIATALAVNVGTAGAPVINGGVLGTPSSGTATNLTGLPLSTGVTGTLPIANGGTSLTTLTANNVILGNGTSAPLFVAPSTLGNVLTSNGTTWASTAPAAGGITYTTTKTANYTAVSNDGVLTNTTAGAFTVTLPASPSNGAQVIVADAAGTWGTNNLTVGRNGNNIADLAQDLVCDISGVSVQFVYNSSGTPSWEVYAQIGGNSGTVVTENGTQTLINKTISGASNTITNISLIAGVTGTLPVVNGGTGATSLTSNNVLLGNGTSAIQTVAPGTTGNVLTSNGTTWQSTAPTTPKVGYLWLVGSGSF